MAKPIDQGFAEYVRAREGHLLRSAYLLCGDEHLAQDLLQEALVKLAMRWDRVKEGHPDAYVRRTMYHDMISHRRRTWRERLTEAPPETGHHRANQADSDSRLDLNVVLQALAPRQRAIVVLRHFDDLTEDAVAQVLGIAVGTVKSQHHAAMRTLRALVRETPEPAPIGSEAQPRTESP